MCAIIGCVGPKGKSILSQNLHRLHHRGYESFGMVVIDEGAPRMVAGEIGHVLAELQHMSGIEGGIAVAGRMNPEPFSDCTRKFFVVYSGHIENGIELKQQLISRGHRFHTDSESEILPHLIEAHFDGSLQNSVAAALRETRGRFVVLVITKQDRCKIIAAQKRSSLIIGLGEDENLLATDAAALLPHTDQLLVVNDCEIVTVEHSSVELSRFDEARISRPQYIGYSPNTGERHGLLKDIFDQPAAICDTFRSRVSVDKGVVLEPEIGPVEIFQLIRRVVIVSHGSAYHAALAGKTMLEAFARLHVEVQYASEFGPHYPLLGPETMVIAVAPPQEGEDLVAAIAAAREMGAVVLTICDSVKSTAAGFANRTLYTYAGAESGITSTKTFTAQLVAFYLLALFAARMRHTMSFDEIRQRTKLLNYVPEQVERILDDTSGIEGLAQTCCSYPHALFLGRGINYPIALEGAFKLTELSNHLAEAHPGGEVRHAASTLMHSNAPVLVVAPQDSAYRKTLSDIETIRAHARLVLAIANDGDEQMRSRADYTIRIPRSDEFLNPILSVIPLQLLAYHIARLQGVEQHCGFVTTRPEPQFAIS